MFPGYNNDRNPQACSRLYNFGAFRSLWKSRTGGDNMHVYRGTLCQPITCCLCALAHSYLVFYLIVHWVWDRETVLCISHLSSTCISLATVLYKSGGSIALRTIHTIYTEVSISRPSIWQFSNMQSQHFGTRGFKHFPEILEVTLIRWVGVSHLPNTLGAAVDSVESK